MRHVKPAPFDYHAPESVAEASALLKTHGETAKVLAGGQSLVPLLNLRLARFEHLVDVGRIDELRRVDCGREGVRLGAMVRQCDIEEDAAIASAAPLLAAATPLIGHFQIRSRGTIGGSLAHADPAAEYPAVALALDAQLDVTGPNGARTIPAAEFFAGTWTTAMDPDELLTSVFFPSWGGASGFAIEEVARRHGDFAIAGACAAIRLRDTTIERAAVAMFGMSSTPVRATAAETALVGLSADGVDAATVAEIAVDGLHPPDDLHASRELRRHIARTVVMRAVRNALDNVRHG
jgi:carbon-monoxide dehydrogenase medium subunit